MVGLFLSSIKCLADKYNKNAIKPDTSGDVIQLEAMPPTVPQETFDAPLEINTNPTIAPTIECVVDTGHPFELAIRSHKPAAKSEESMPIINIFTSSLYIEGSTIPFLIVEVTSPPAKYAPKNSNIAAIITACLRVIALLPTEVPIALATSFAPIPNAIKKPISPANIMINVGSKNKFSININLN